LDPRIVDEKYIRPADNLNIGKKLFLICTFLQLCICYLETELNLDPDPNPELITDLDPTLQIITDPAGSGSTTLVAGGAATCILYISPVAIGVR
jgi:hypothetical protein